MTRSVVVTGTSGGIGRATAAHLLAQGYRVVGVARRDVTSADVSAAAPTGAERGEPVAGEYVHVRADLSDLAAIPELARELVASAGGSLYGLVNNAASGADGLLATMHNSEVVRTVELDLVSPLLLTKYLVRPMLSARAGRVVSISSVVARTGYRGLSAYAAAKAGLEGFTRSLAREVGPRGVTVNCVAPGFLDTAMTARLPGQSLERIRRRSPLDRFATVDEVAAAVSYLLSPAAAGVTGTVITVDAGGTA